MDGVPRESELAEVDESLQSRAAKAANAVVLQPQLAEGGESVESGEAFDAVREEPETLEAGASRGGFQRRDGVVVEDELAELGQLGKARHGLEALVGKLEPAEGVGGGVQAREDAEAVVRQAEVRQRAARLERVGVERVEGVEGDLHVRGGGQVSLPSGVAEFALGERPRRDIAVVLHTDSRARRRRRAPSAERRRGRRARGSARRQLRQPSLTSCRAGCRRSTDALSAQTGLKMPFKPREPVDSGFPCLSFPRLPASAPIMPNVFEFHSAGTSVRPRVVDDAPRGACDVRRFTLRCCHDPAARATARNGSLVVRYTDIAHSDYRTRDRTIPRN